MRIAIIVSLLILIMGACACNRNSTSSEPMSMDSIKKTYNEPMMEWNHAKIRDQDIMIKRYAERRNWDMTRSDSGLYYSIYETENGMKADSGYIAVFHYDLHLLDGQFCYSSDSTGPRQIKLGRANIESGLEEALLAMRIGDKAHVIIPPHLAYGMPGDGNKIPADAILVYDVELRELY
ncbi:MAG: FKBP-type peptidyl-prolyl cis-trans isomerase [Bacteroidales bacterium]|jgi:FKBP-type peptidyl-prolyl cis-trans isomerase|nr:FKBP-type peptidyl-prolyl cis-trans isomerase [Bacteroidales bacterium]